MIRSSQETDAPAAQTFTAFCEDQGVRIGTTLTCIWTYSTVRVTGFVEPDSYRDASIVTERLYPDPGLRITVYGDQMDEWSVA